MSVCVFKYGEDFSMFRYRKDSLVEKGVKMAGVRFLRMSMGGRGRL